MRSGASRAGWVYSFDYSYIISVVNSLPIPITLTLFIPCLTLFVLVLWSVVVLRSSQGFGKSLVDSLQVRLLVVIVFETGLYFFDPTWWSVHVTNLNLYPFTLLTNEIVFSSALVLLVVGLSYRAFYSQRARFFFRKATVKRLT